MVNIIFFPLYLFNDYWWYLVKLLIYSYLFCIVLLSTNINEIIFIADIYLMFTYATSLSTLNISFYLVFLIHQWGQYYYHPLFMDENTET